MGTHTDVLGMDLLEGDRQEWMHDWWRTVGGETWNPFPGAAIPKATLCCGYLAHFPFGIKTECFGLPLVSPVVLSCGRTFWSLCWEQLDMGWDWLWSWGSSYVGTSETIPKQLVQHCEKKAQTSPWNDLAWITLWATDKGAFSLV